MNELQRSVNRLLGGHYPIDYEEYLKLLVKVVGSYIDDDFGAAEQKALNDLNAVLHKHNILDITLIRIHPGIPRDEINRISVSVDECYRMTSEIVNVISKWDTTIDIASLLLYVKRKAAQCGDWPIAEE